MEYPLRPMTTRILFVLTLAACDAGSGAISDGAYDLASSTECMPGPFPSDPNAALDEMAPVDTGCRWAMSHAGMNGSSFCLPTSYDSMSPVQKSVTFQHGLTHLCQDLRSPNDYSGDDATSKYVRETQAFRAELRAMNAHGAQCSNIYYFIDSAMSRMTAEYGLHELGDFSDRLLPILEMELARCEG